MEWTASLWDDAGDGFDADQRIRATAAADAELEPVMPFLLAARSDTEYAHRRALAGDRLESIAVRTGLPLDEVTATADRRWQLYREALAEGQDPLEEVCDASEGGSGYGGGPEKPDGHSEAFDPSGGYSEVPMGAPGGPPPQVTQPRIPQPAPVTEATGMRRTAQGQQFDTTPAGPSNQGGASANMPAGTGGGGAPAAMTPGAAPSGGLSTGTGNPVAAPAQPNLSTSMPPTSTTSSRRDPVARQIASIAASVQASNPHLPEGECRRVARRVVAGYLHRADLASSVMSDDPNATASGSGDGGSKGGGGMSGLEEYGLGRALVSKLPEIGELAAL